MRAFLCCLLLIIAAPFSASGLEVAFKADVVARSDILTIGDVADLSPESQARDLADKELFAAPGPGETRCYKSRTLMAYVRQAVSADHKVKRGGAEQVCVRHDGARLLSGKIQSVVNAHLQSALSHLGAKRVAFEMRNPPESLSLPKGQAEYEILFAGNRILDARKVTVIVRVDGNVVENLSIAGRIRAYLPVVTAARKLGRNTVVTENDLAMREKNIADLRRPCLDPEAAVGMRVKRAVPMGKVLEKNDLDAPVLVKRREVVTMILDQGPMRIRARGMATVNGKKGEVIPVQNMSSKREVICEVTGRKQVRVEF
ncbi:MAG: flagellar basal body P-ring formation chaperone FlgA [Desulfosalsimonas sp.]|uniref:flagellar basal body P-ring formation chaperone FlgA n=1 Tax=Desulfosalsimonas sp. TaxID=3073848 RepID=UPI003970D765